MRLLLDQSSPRSAAQLLRDGGMDVLHVGEIGLSTATDSELLQAAHNDDRTVVTLDADFHALLAVSGTSKPRIEGLNAQMVADLLTRIVPSLFPDLEKRAVVTVQENRIRLRRLPIRG